MNDFEDTFVEVFQKDSSNAHDDICTNVAQYCEEGVDYSLEDTIENINTDSSDETDKTEL